MMQKASMKRPHLDRPPLLLAIALGWVLATIYGCAAMPLKHGDCKDDTFVCLALEPNAVAAFWDGEVGHVQAVAADRWLHAGHDGRLFVYEAWRDMDRKPDRIMVREQYFRWYSRQIR